MSRGEIVLEVSRSIYLFKSRSKVMGIPSGPRTSYINDIDIKCLCAGSWDAVGPRSYFEQNTSKYLYLGYLGFIAKQKAKSI